MKPKLNGGNLVRGVNTWVVSLLTYSAEFVSRSKSEVEAIDRKTRKLLTIYVAYTLSQMETDYIYLGKKKEEI